MDSKGKEAYEAYVDSIARRNPGYNYKENMPPFERISENAQQGWEDVAQHFITKYVPLHNIVKR